MLEPVNHYLYNMKVPTDLQILAKIAKLYSKDFISFVEGESNRNSKIYVPIDVDRIGKDLGVDGDIIFGRLYYHLNNKFSYKKEDGTKVEFFARQIGPIGKEDKHCIQFPYAISVLADLKYENKKFRIATIIAVVSIIISLISVTIAILT